MSEMTVISERVAAWCADAERAARQYAKKVGASFPLIRREPAVIPTESTMRGRPLAEPLDAETGGHPSGKPVRHVGAVALRAGEAIALIGPGVTHRCRMIAARRLGERDVLVEGEAVVFVGRACPWLTDEAGGNHAGE